MGSSARAGMLRPILPHGPVGSTTGAINGAWTRRPRTSPDHDGHLCREWTPTVRDRAATSRDRRQTPAARQHVATWSSTRPVACISA
ncbi:hypothetical protein ACFPM0_31660 [Pseudonocardia sulfidoxydans]|uniref:hypothetical protein n=1 Tax=Pseudonocardia sulfidoxydans TaxID=54011 RepID=UPI003608CB28